MLFRNIFQCVLALSVATILSACGGSSGSGNKPIANVPAVVISSAPTSAAASSAQSSAVVAVIQDTTLVLPSSLEVVTNEAAK